MRPSPLQERALRQPQYTITPKDVDHHAARLCQDRRKLQDHGRPCRAGVLLNMLCSAAARISSIAAACKALQDARSDPAVSDALAATLPPLHELQRRVHRALAGDLAKALGRRPPPLAIALVLIPDHGRHQSDPDEVDRSQAQEGTSQFHASATASVLRTGCRFTPALTSVRTGEGLEALVPRLLRQAVRVGVKPRSRRLDRGCSSVGVIRSRPAARLRFRLPVALRGRKLSHPPGPAPFRPEWQQVHPHERRRNRSGGPPKGEQELIS